MKLFYVTIILALLGSNTALAQKDVTIRGPSETPPRFRIHCTYDDYRAHEPSNSPFYVSEKGGRSFFGTSSNRWFEIWYDDPSRKLAYQPLWQSVGSLRYPDPAQGEILPMFGRLYRKVDRRGGGPDFERLNDDEIPKGCDVHRKGTLIVPLSGSLPKGDHGYSYPSFKGADGFLDVHFPNVNREEGVRLTITSIEPAKDGSDKYVAKCMKNGGALTLREGETHGVGGRFAFTVLRIIPRDRELKTIGWIEIKLSWQDEPVVGKSETPHVVTLKRMEAETLPPDPNCGSADRDYFLFWRVIDEQWRLTVWSRKKSETQNEPDEPLVEEYPGYPAPVINERFPLFGSIFQLDGHGYRIPVTGVKRVDQEDFPKGCEVEKSGTWFIPLMKGAALPEDASEYGWTRQSPYGFLDVNFHEDKPGGVRFTVTSITPNPKDKTQYVAECKAGVWESATSDKIVSLSLRAGETYRLDDDPTHTITVRRIVPWLKESHIMGWVEVELGWRKESLGDKSCNVVPLHFGRNPVLGDVRVPFYKSADDLHRFYGYWQEIERQWFLQVWSAHGERKGQFAHVRPQFPAPKTDEIFPMFGRLYRTTGRDVPDTLAFKQLQDDEVPAGCEVQPSGTSIAPLINADTPPEDSHRYQWNVPSPHGFLDAAFLRKESGGVRFTITSITRNAEDKQKCTAACKAGVSTSEAAGKVLSLSLETGKTYRLNDDPSHGFTVIRIVPSDEELKTIGWVELELSWIKGD